MESLAYSALLLPPEPTIKTDVILRHLPWTVIGSTASLVVASTTLPAGAIVGQGATCSDTVREIQTALTAQNYDVGGIDGIFGTNTYNAIVQFQKAQNLQADGVVGVNTATALGLSGEVYASGSNCGPVTSTTNTSNPNASNSTASNSTADVGNGLYIVTAEALNVRSSPAFTAEVVDILFKDAQIEATESEPGWLNIAEGQWVSAQFVERSDSNAATVDASDLTEAEEAAIDEQTLIDAEALNAAFASGFVRVSVNALNVRTGPGSNYNVVGYVAQDELLPLTGRATEDGWVQVGWGDWISSAFVDPVDVEQTNASASSAADDANATGANATGAEVTTIALSQLDANLTNQVQVTADNLNVRSGPGTAYPVVGSLIKNDVVPLSGQATEDGWIQLTWGDWVSSAFVNPVVIRDRVES